MATNHHHPSANQAKNANQCVSLLSSHINRSNTGNPAQLSVRVLKLKVHSSSSSAPSSVALVTSQKRPLTTAPCTTISQERESCEHSAKRMKTNESTEQKAQYRETMLRLQTWIRGFSMARNNAIQTRLTGEALPSVQEQSATKSSSFDRLRSSSEQMPKLTSQLDEINNSVNDHANEITANEKVLDDNPSCSSQVGFYSTFLPGKVCLYLCI